MKHPFWIINLGLVSLVLFACTFIYFSSVKVPRRESIQPEQITVRKERKVAINIEKIYEHDLFGTYVKELPKTQSIDAIIPFPAPPAQQKIVAPKITEPEFLDPLQITLMGIIVVGSNDTKNRAIIQEDKSKQENTYKVGDIIQDAQIIRIFKNKIILLRLNGQQEILYLREQDAKTDSSYTQINEWDSVVKKIAEGQYLVSPETLVENVKTLTQFINMLNTTTAYQKGKSVGLRIGQLVPQSLGAMLGLQKDDIITHINGISTQTTDERLAIYKNVTTLPLDHSVKLRIIRRNREIILTYTLNDFSKKESTETTLSMNKNSSAGFFHENALNSRQQHLAFAPTLNKIRKADSHVIREKGKI
jgi:type II secretory pathway component PulC